MRIVTTTNTTTNGGGESSTTGNTLGISDPLTSNTFGILRQIIAVNLTGANGNFFCDLDSATIGDAMDAVADIAETVNAAQTMHLTEEDFGLRYVTEGTVYQASNAATGDGWKVTFVVDFYR